MERKRRKPDLNRPKMFSSCIFEEILFASTFSSSFTRQLEREIGLYEPIRSGSEYFLLNKTIISDNRD